MLERTDNSLSQAQIIPAAGAAALASPTFRILLAGALATASASIYDWLNADSWSIGEYNLWMQTMDDTIKQWDALGWANGCWAAHPTQRKAWRDYWARFSKHYAQYGTVSDIPGNWLSDSAEKPARALMQELASWGTWLNQTCGVPLSAGAGLPGTGVGQQTFVAPGLPAPAPQTGDGFNWMDLIKIGGIGLIGLVLLSVLRETKNVLK